jgi:hypothetical protein
MFLVNHGLWVCWTEPESCIDLARLRMRVLPTKAHCDPDAFLRIVREYRERATAYGFERHMAKAPTP